MSNSPLSSNDPQARLTRKGQPATDAAPASETEPPEALQGSVVAKGPADSTDTVVDEAAKQDFLWHTDEYLGDYARFADTKAAFAGAIASALLGALYSAKAHVAMFHISPYQWTAFTWFAALGGLFLVASVVFSIWTVLPRLGRTEAKGFIYWGGIAAYERAASLEASFHSQSARSLNDHLLRHVFDVASKVLVPKYRAAYLCIVALCVGGFLTAVALVLQDIPSEGAR